MALFSTRAALAATARFSPLPRSLKLSQQLLVPSIGIRRKLPSEPIVHDRAGLQDEWACN
jgi:hypothetical protein